MKDKYGKLTVEKIILTIKYWLQGQPWGEAREYVEVLTKWIEK